MSFPSRLRGSLYGLAVGDALGAPYEFKPRGTYQVSGEMEPSQTFTHNGHPLPPGTFTDDTSLALCLGASLVQCNGLVWQDAARRMTDWYTNGYMSAIDKCFDIGNATRQALDVYRSRIMSSKPLDKCAGPTEPSASGNGSLMRLAPIPVYFAHDPSLAVSNAALQSKITHGSPLTIESCMLATAQIIGFLNQPESLSPEARKRTVLAPNYLPELLPELNIKTEQISDLWRGDYKSKKSEDISTSGFVVDSHEAALWALWTYSTFEEGMLKLLTMGGDVDTVCAIYGQIAGACYGMEAIPQKWVDALRRRDMLDAVYEPLIEKAVVHHG